MGKEETQQTAPEGTTQQENAQGKPDASKKKQKKDQKEELSEEDLQKKQEFDMLVERVKEGDSGVQKLALEQIRTEIRTSTTSMTSVPKPLKFLRPHYNTLKERFETIENADNKALLSDIVSILAMTMTQPVVRECLKYCLSGSKEAISSWGHEYVRHLSGEIGEEWEHRLEEQTQEKDANKMEVQPTNDDLLKLIDEIVPYQMQHNAEHEACDLLMEVGLLDKILPHVDDTNFSRVCLYLTQCANYVPEPDDTKVLQIALEIYKRLKQWPSALRLAMKLGDQNVLREVFDACEDLSVKKQLGFQLARQNIQLEGYDDYSEIMSNSHLSEYFLALGQDLDIMEAKTPEDIYKSNNDNRNTTYATNVDSARGNLANTFVNAFVNAGFGQDKLMTDEGNKWIYKNKDHGMLSATASLGMVLLWDVDGGLTQIDKYLYSNEDHIKAGALLAVGIVNSGVRNEVDPALALLTDYLENQNATIKAQAILGLGLAYVGSAREDICGLLLPIVEDTNVSMEVAATAGLALGMIFVGTANPDITQSITQTLMERDAASLNATHSRFLCLALGLLYVGKQALADVTIETLRTIEHPIGQYAVLTVESCAYLGSGNVLKVQKFLGVCSDHLTPPPAEEGKDKKDAPAVNNNHQSVAALGIALIAMGEDIGADMAIRAYDHLLQYGDPVVRKAVPLALGLLSLSNPRMHVMDTLSKLSHDSDEEVAISAILGLGLISAGTNNARVGGLLRGLASYYYKDPNHLFMVRVAQGLTFMGKGTMTLAPYHSDRFLLSQVAITGILTVLHASLDIKNTLLSKSHHLLYCLVTAMRPRLLMTFDEDLKPLPVSVRVGQAVDTIGQAGRPKTITGFQTHTTPVLLGYNDRAELATDDYIALTPILEGFVILRKNPDAAPKEEETKGSKK